MAISDLPPAAAAEASAADSHATHTVFNQPPPLVDYNVFASDRALEALRREGAEWAEERVRAFGEIAGCAETIARKASRPNRLQAAGGRCIDADW